MSPNWLRVADLALTFETKRARYAGLWRPLPADFTFARLSISSLLNAVEIAAAGARAPGWGTTPEIYIAACWSGGRPAGLGNELSGDGDASSRDWRFYQMGAEMGAAGDVLEGRRGAKMGSPMIGLFGFLIDHLGTLMFCACALALFASSLVMARRGRSAECIGYGLGAILLLGAAVAFELDVVPQYQSQQDLISGLRKRNEVLSRERDSALEQASDYRVKEGEDARKLNAELTQMREAFDTFLRALTARGLSAPRTDQTPPDSVSGVESIRSMTTAIRNLSTFLLSEAQVPCPGDVARHVGAPLKQQMGTTIRTAHYEIGPVKDKRLRMPTAGAIYAVVIKDAEASERLTFERRYYTLRSKERALLHSLQRFITEVASPLRRAVPIRVYIRGMADVDSYDGPLEVGFEYDSLTYRRERTPQVYLGDVKTVKISSVTNQQLPNFRGRYVSERWSELGSGIPFEVLEGVPSKKVNPTKISFDLFLVVDW